MKRFSALALLVVMVGCAAPPPPCPALPMPFGTTRTARDAHALLVIDLYGRCAASRNPPKGQP